jgi:hypothetical protein
MTASFATSDPPFGPSLSTLVDDFSTPVDPDLWSASPDDTVSRTVDGQLVLTVSDWNGTYLTWASPDMFDLTDSHAFVELVSIGTPPDGASQFAGFFVSSLDGLYTFTMSVEDGVYSEVVSIYDGEDYETNTLYSAPYDPTIHRWWRVSQTDGNVHLGHSPDGVSWTDSPYPYTPDSPVYPFFSGWYDNGLGGPVNLPFPPNDIVFDNLNVPPFSALVDDFSLPLDPAVWLTYPDGTGAAAEDGQLHIMLPGDTGASAYTAGVYDLAESHVAIELVSLGTPPPDADQWVGFMVAYNDFANSFFLNVYEGDYTAQQDFNVLYTTPYDPVVQRWLRMRHTAGELHFEHSPDGLAWTDDLAVPLDPVPAMVLSLTCAYYNGSVTDPNDVIFDNLNVPPAPATSSTVLIGPLTLTCTSTLYGGGGSYTLIESVQL